MRRSAAIIMMKAISAESMAVGVSELSSFLIGGKKFPTMCQVQLWFPQVVGA